MHEMNAFPLSRNIIISAKVVFLGETDHHLFSFFYLQCKYFITFFISVFPRFLSRFGITEKRHWLSSAKPMPFQCNAVVIPVQCR